MCLYRVSEVFRGLEMLKFVGFEKPIRIRIEIGFFFWLRRWRGRATVERGRAGLFNVGRGRA